VPRAAGAAPLLLALGTIAFCSMLGEGAVFDWSAVYLRSLGADAWLAAAGYTSFSLAMAAARLAGDRLTQRIGPRPLVRASGLLAGGGLAASLALAQPVAALAGFAAIGLGLALVVPLVFSAAARVPGTAAGPAIAAVTTTGYLGFLAGPPAIGLIAEAFGLPAALALVVVGCLVITALSNLVEAD